MADEPYSVTAAAAAASESGVDNPAATDYTKTVDDQVSNIVGGVSSWWNSFSQQSQQFISSTQKHIEDQGGVVAAARNEFSRIEKEIGKAATPRGAEGDAAPSFEALSNNVWSSLQGLAHIPQVQQLREQVAAGLPRTGDAQQALASLPAFHEVETLGAKYLEAGEGFARDVGRDLKGTLDSIIRFEPGAPQPSVLDGEAVDIEASVTAENDDHGASQRTPATATGPSVPAVTTTIPAAAGAGTGATDTSLADDDFSWDDEEEAAEPSTSLPPAPPPANPDGDTDDDWE